MRLFLVLAAALAPQAALAQSVDLAARLDLLWVSVAAALVLLMQVGFMMLEAGLTRAKNAVNVAQKNLADFALSILMFALLGFALMFGASQGGVYGWFGWSDNMVRLSDMADADLMFFVFQAMFVGTAATIMSGAVAERFSYLPYMLTIPVISLLIYPVFGHWAWGNLLLAENAPWLADMGFVDFAGSTVVHLVGGAVALAGAVAVGPRAGRYDAQGRPVRLNGHNAVLAMAGAFLLFLGWLGFNGGSTLAAGEAVAPILAATVLAGASGACVGMIAGRLIDGHYHPTRMINGLLGGLVAVTAGAHLADSDGALLIGAAGALVAVLAEDALARLGVDDPVGAVAVHGAAGAFGTLAIVLLAPAADLPAGAVGAQLGVQALGVGVAFAWAFGVAYVWFRLLGTVVPLRVSARDETVGLNVAEHETHLGTGKVQDMLIRLLESDLGGADRLEEEHGDEAGELIDLFNRLLDAIQTHDQRRLLIEKEMRLLGEGAAAERAANIERWRADRDLERQLVHEIVDIVDKVAKGDFDRRATLTQQNEHLAAVGEGVNRMLDHLTGLMRSTIEGARMLSVQSAGQQSSATQLADISTRQADAVVMAVEDLRTLRGEIDTTLGNAETARQAADRTSISAEAGGNAIEMAVSTIHEIRAQSQRIVDVLESINEIASQTNLLAINAAVEAARAGEQGRGFAVVAAEVRALATRTQDMARVIRERVKDTEAAVESGVQVVGETTEALADIRASAGKTQTNMQHIQEAARIQAERAAGLLEAIEAIGEMGQRNRAIAQETAESATALRAETDRLSDAARAFDDAADGEQRRSQAALEHDRRADAADGAA